jgi:hypothetical protein
MNNIYAGICNELVRGSLKGEQFKAFRQEIRQEDQSLNSFLGFQTKEERRAWLSQSYI